MQKIVIVGLIVAIFLLALSKSDKKAVVSKPKSKEIEFISEKSDIKSETKPVGPKTESKPLVVTTYAEAVKASKQYSKPIFIYFGAEWCGPCKLMKTTTLADPEVKGKLNSDYVVLIVDIDRDRDLTNRFKVTGVPTYMIVASDETVATRSSGFIGKVEFLDWLKLKNVTCVISK